MGEDQERDKDEAATTKADDKKLADLTADKKDKDVKGGGSKPSVGVGGKAGDLA